jgi:hypothetical protein
MPVLRGAPRPSHRENRAAHALMPPLRLMNWARGSESGFVGIKSGATHPRTLDVLAIISAAVGTGIASLIAFYNPREEYLRTARAISQLSQLQTEISFLIGSEKACEPSNENNSKLVVDWFGRLSAISTASENFGGTETKQEPEKKP